MIDKALAGELDYLVVKDVPRFARNTTDACSGTSRLTFSHPDELPKPAIFKASPKALFFCPKNGFVFPSKTTVTAIARDAVAVADGHLTEPEKYGFSSVGRCGKLLLMGNRLD